MTSINDSYVIKQYSEGFSTIAIAKELGTYPKKIERVLKKNGQKMRTRSESQALAIQKGRSAHPTKGKVRSEEDKIKISLGVEKAWLTMDADKKEKFCQSAKERWKDMSAEKKREMQEKAGRALRLACIEGSKQEKFLQNKLVDAGYSVEMHKKGLIQGKFEIDLLLPELNTIIEVDGPQHYLPIFGQDKLNETIRMDGIKNGLLVGRGFCVIRVKYLAKNMNKRVERDLWNLVSSSVQEVAKSFPPEGKRLIEIEIK